MKEEVEKIAKAKTAQMQKVEQQSTMTACRRGNLFEALRRHQPVHGVGP
jgi:hypothetical protein